ncbi:hypothetical protein N9A94_08825, partial [Akkermansiaceae bacterium]|nr:hypothetical protein [Akkermansiaceae bacterium]
ANFSMRCCDPRSPLPQQTDKAPDSVCLGMRNKGPIRLTIYFRQKTKTNPDKLSHLTENLKPRCDNIAIPPF